MKIILVLFLSSLPLLASFGNVQTYFNISKEGTYIKQEEEAYKDNYPGFGDVDGFSSRLGFIKEENIKYGLKVRGNAELYISTALDDDNGESFKVGKAYISVQRKFLFFKAGKDSLPFESHLKSLDPFYKTGGQLLGSSNRDTVGSVHEKFGLFNRTNVNHTTFGIKTSNTEVLLSHDRSSTDLDANSQAVLLNNISNYYSLLATQKLQLRSTSLMFGLYAGLEDQKFSSNPFDEKYLGASIQYKVNKLIFNTGLTQHDLGSIMDDNNVFREVIHNYYFLTATYKHLDLETSLTYGMTELGKIGSEIGEQDQIALGTKFHISESFNVWGIWKQVHINRPTTWLGPKTDNTASYLILGLSYSHKTDF